MDKASKYLAFDALSTLTVKPGSFSADALPDGTDLAPPDHRVFFLQ